MVTKDGPLYIVKLLLEVVASKNANFFFSPQLTQRFAQLNATLSMG
jgi:hypothetical protein